MGHVDRLGDRSRQKRLGGRHHGDVGAPPDTPLSAFRPKGTIEDGQMFLPQFRRSFDRVILIDVAGDPFDFIRLVTQGAKPQRDGLVHDLQHASPGQLLVFDQRDVGFNSRRVAVHQKTDGAGRCQDRGLGIAEAVAAATAQDIIPQVASRFPQIVRNVFVDLLDRIPMHFHHTQEGFPIFGIAGQRVPSPPPTRYWSGWPLRAGSP